MVWYLVMLIISVFRNNVKLYLRKLSEKEVKKCTKNFKGY